MNKHIKIFEDFNNDTKTIESAGKYSFPNFLQIVGNHKYHFVYSEFFTNLYRYLYFFVTETVKDNEEFLNVFKYKSSLKLTYSTLQKLSQNKLSFFFGINNQNILRYGFLDQQSRRSFVTGEFKVNDKYFGTLKNIPALEFCQRFLVDINIKHISLMRRIKLELKNFYPSKKSKLIELRGKDMVVAHFDRHKFTDEEISMNRPFRVLHEWVSSKEWRGGVHYYVDENENELEFIIIVH